MLTDPRETNGSKIATLRITNGMTQKQLADAIGGRQVDISRWERGVVTPSAKKLAAIAAALGCRMDDLM